MFLRVLRLRRPVLQDQGRRLHPRSQAAVVSRLQAPRARSAAPQLQLRDGATQWLGAPAPPAQPSSPESQLAAQAAVPPGAEPRRQVTSATRPSCCSSCAGPSVLQPRQCASAQGLLFIGRAHVDRVHFACQWLWLHAAQWSPAAPRAKVLQNYTEDARRPAHSQEAVLVLDHLCSGAHEA